MKRKAEDHFFIANQIVNKACNRACIQPEELQKAPSTRMMTRLRKEISNKLRKDTDIGDPHIGKFLGRPNWRSSRHVNFKP